jgi:hypothetical protein
LLYFSDLDLFQEILPSLDLNLIDPEVKPPRRRPPGRRGPVVCVGVVQPEIRSLSQFPLHPSAAIWRFRESDYRLDRPEKLKNWLGENSRFAKLAYLDGWLKRLLGEMSGWRLTGCMGDEYDQFILADSDGACQHITIDLAGRILLHDDETYSPFLDQFKKESMLKPALQGR